MVSIIAVVVILIAVRDVTVSVVTADTTETYNDGREEGKG
eukprot:CAMPEP_0118642280 /NCGR_PEP_ID=MMETSP0785-20121206/5753_1 /TAXON_ID=91992 /ORGANISM="Bolidomonas pacifica, Strain CCMP 1866" /LENGTH=39 /DNA_ID= /DNA_START= /DNA_END= /DNA_ORIENTATION=